MSSCIVSGCNSGYRRKQNEPQNLHMFYPPKNDAALFAKWERMCCPKADKRLSIKHRVCHKHFTDDMLVTHKEIPLADGTVYHYALELWRLKPGAFPCIFEGCGRPDWPAGTKNKQTKLRAKKRKIASLSDVPGKVVSTAVKGTQTDICGNFCFPVQPVWDTEDLAPKRPALREYDEQNGVFVPFDGLTGQQKAYVMSLARKAYAKSALNGCKDHPYHGYS